MPSGNGTDVSGSGTSVTSDQLVVAGLKSLSDKYGTGDYANEPQMVFGSYCTGQDNCNVAYDSAIPTDRITHSAYSTTTDTTTINHSTTESSTTIATSSDSTKSTSTTTANAASSANGIKFATHLGMMYIIWFLKM